jgi:hypothetical protein
MRGRALADYRLANATAFSVADCSALNGFDAGIGWARDPGDKIAKKQIRDLLELAMTAEASEMLAASSGVR